MLVCRPDLWLLPPEGPSRPPPSGTVRTHTLLLPQRSHSSGLAADIRCSFLVIFLSYLLACSLLTPRPRPPPLRSPLPDLVQDLYVKELKAYKAPPAAKDAAAAVKKFVLPAAPAAPAPVTANLAGDLEAYENTPVDRASATSESGEEPKSVDEKVRDQFETWKKKPYLPMLKNWEGNPPKDHHH